MKIKRQKETKRDEIRKNKDSNHPTYVYAKVGHRFKFLGITHSPITDNVENIKLEKNPNPRDKKAAYIRPKAEEANTNRFKAKEKDWKLSKKDKERIKPYQK